MSFLDILIAADDSLAHGRPEEDASIRFILTEAALDGSYRTLRDAMHRGQIDARTDQDILNAAVNVIGHDRASRRMGERDKEARYGFLAEFVGVTVGDKPKDNASPAGQRWTARMSGMLSACFGTYLHAHDHVAGELLKMGAPVYAVYQAPRSTPFMAPVPGEENDPPKPEPVWNAVSGARLFTAEKADTVTILARAIAIRSRWTADMVAQDKTDLQPVATIRVGNEEASVTAAGYALVLGDPVALRKVLAGVDKTNERIQRQLGEAIEMAIKFGLLDFGPDEVLQCVTALLAAGAQLKNPAQFLGRRITLVDIPALANDPLATPAQVKEIQEAVETTTISLPAAVLHAPNTKDVAQAIRALHAVGWDTNIPVRTMQGLDAQNVPGKTVAHLAAFRGNVEILAALEYAQTDLKRPDENGFTPLRYAQAGALTRGQLLSVDVARMIEPTYVPRATDSTSDADRAAGHLERLAEEEASMEARASQASADRDAPAAQARGSRPAPHSPASGTGPGTEARSDLGTRSGIATPADETASISEQLSGAAPVSGYGARSDSGTSSTSNTASTRRGPAPAPQSAPDLDDLDAANAAALVAGNEERDSYGFEGFGDDTLPPPDLFAPETDPSTKPGAGAAGARGTGSGTGSVAPIAVRPPAVKRSMSGFDLLRAGQAARNAVPPPVNTPSAPASHPRP